MCWVRQSSSLFNDTGRFSSLVVMDIRLKEMFGDEMVLHAIALLVPLGPACV